MEEELKLTMIETPLSDVASEAAKGFEGLARSQGKRLKISIEPDISDVCDEKSVRQLIGILLDNAVKYSPEGGEIALELKKTGRSARIKVTNETETAIDKEKLALMFDRFYRGDASRGEKSGYGIGLSIAKAVVEAHKGKISASSPDVKHLIIEAVI
jgi:signal transduction histidine kinase